jgi:methyl-accepting chemotaxis protein
MSYLDQFRFTPKLLVLPLTLSLATAALGVYAEQALTDAATRTTDLYENQLKPVTDVGELAESFQRSRGNIIESMYTTDPTARARLLQTAAERDRDIQVALDRYEPTIVLDADRRAFAEVKTSLTEFDTAEVALNAALAADDQAAVLQVWTSRCEPARNRAQTAIDALLQVNLDLATANVEASAASAEELRRILLVSTGALVALAMLYGVVLARGLSGRARELASLANKVALGEHVDVQVSGRDELAAVSAAFRTVVVSQGALAAAATRLAAGDADVHVEPRGPDDTLSHAFINLTSVTTRLTQDLRTLVVAAQQGNLAERGDTSHFQGAFAGIVSNINAMLDAIVAPITEAAEVLDRVAARDLRAEVRGDYLGDYDRIKVSLNMAVSTLRDALQQVATASDQVTAAAGQIASSAQAVAQGASEQASALEQTSASLETMSSVTSQNAANASQADGLARDAKIASDQGIHAMSGMNEAMQRIRASAEGTAAIIRDINEIAFQTNLLALNAAVEAARAGDAGRGFAVVAEEVRNLAMRSKEAARRTETLIQESVDLARQGENMSRQVNTNLGEIVGSVGKVSAIVSEIATGSTGQARGINEVNRAVSEMEKVTQQNAANAEEAASAVEELSGQTRELAAMVARFELGTDAPVVRARTAAPRPKPTTKPSTKPSSYKPSLLPDVNEAAFRDF